MIRMVRIEGIIDRHRRRVYLSLPVIFKGKAVMINFVVDTGAFSTSLGFSDAEKLSGMNVAELPKYERQVIGVGGNVDTRYIEGNVQILAPNGEILMVYDKITTVVPRVKSGGKKIDIHDPRIQEELAIHFPSILGMDIISKGGLYINFKRNVAYLEF